MWGPLHTFCYSNNNIIKQPDSVYHVSDALINYFHILLILFFSIFDYINLLNAYICTTQ